MRHKIWKVCTLLPALMILVILMHAFLLPSEAAKTYQYRVISIQGMTQLRTQSKTEGGRMVNVERIINDQASEGWEFMQADGYILYFRK